MQNTPISNLQEVPKTVQEYEQAINQLSSGKKTALIQATLKR